MVDETIKWIKKYFDGFYVENLFVHGKERIIDKSQLCLDRGIEIMIEDLPKYIESCQRFGVKVLLFDQPWNRKVVENDNVVRVSSWLEIEQLLKKFE